VPSALGPRNSTTPQSTRARLRPTLLDAVLALKAPPQTVYNGEALAASPRRAAFAVVSGFLVARLSGPIGHCAELIGPSEIVVCADAALLPLDARVEWTGAGAAKVAWVDEVAWAALLRHPRWAGALISSQSERAEAARALHAITMMTRVDDRVLRALWLLAERFGRVGPRGTLVDAPVSHRLLGELIGARRPSVTTAVTNLSARGDLSRDDDGRWLLHSRYADSRGTAVTAAYS
jgi:CRP/FNR family cyclic AMP-dependent transcriptional regulator